MMEVDEVRPPVVPEETEVVPPKAQPEVEKIKDVVEEAAKDQTVLVENEAEAFALEPLDITGCCINYTLFYLKFCFFLAALTCFHKKSVLYLAHLIEDA